jgi:hypothetical protein
MIGELTQLRFRADGPDVYATALLRLISYARTSTDDFTFGPVSISDCVRDGISLKGPDLFGAVGVLAAISGLSQVEA